MILVNERAEYLRVFQCEFKPKLSVHEIGTIRKLSGMWALEIITSRMCLISDQLNGSEKRQIIGMLDKLNGITGPKMEFDVYRTNDKSARWNEIIGLT